MLKVKLKSEKKSKESHIFIFVSTQFLLQLKSENSVQHTLKRFIQLQNYNCCCLNK